MNEQRFQPFYQSSGICTDSRKLTANCFFVCIKGENYDGNTFASDALKEGASHVVVDNADYFVDNGKMTLVEDSVRYIQELANYHRKKFHIPVIGITGSNGKTTTKELIHAVLAKKYNVLATIGNLNNHLGVPFTLLRLTEQHEIAIIEMGANHFNDIEELCAIAEPTHGIITNIGKAHLEGFKSFEGVLKTKKELYDSIVQNKGLIVVNSDDSVLTNILPAGIENVRYSALAENARVVGELVGLSPFVQMKWQADGHTSPLIQTQMVGKYNFYNYLAAITFGIVFGVDKDAISEAIAEYSPTNNRSQVKKSGKNTVILDCYNANPTSTRSALESFALIDHPNKVFILGDMLELGAESDNEHQQIMQLAEHLNLSGYVVGKEYGKVQSPAILKKFTDSTALLDDLKANELSNKLILLKGSRGIKLEVAEEAL